MIFWQIIFVESKVTWTELGLIHLFNGDSENNIRKVQISLKLVTGAEGWNNATVKSLPVRVFPLKNPFK